ncbi:acidobacterial duplicated orphan permease [Luteitalea pratensis]|uniref:Acidobacterial duplicated orphan permease n=1 Tax=Luteitalea pratensis TaxID=1855912 RepID=A0A143PIY0_LUTPR|nr:hypothetical protein [Luteitalea pratensis]AMY08366.1 acidobacterial duplicated orphan permease [Luteitalea pratensis]
MRGDLRYAWRTLRRSKGFAAAAIATLAVGIGANTAIFSVINAVILRPLPVDRPEQLVEVLYQQPGRTPESGFSYALWGPCEISRTSLPARLRGTRHSRSNSRVAPARSASRS